MRGWIICLCDYSGIMARPWVEAGCRALLVDPQHPAGTTELDGIVRVGATIVEAFAVLGRIVRGEPIVFVAGFPPCTDLASSGARWWAEKAKRDRYFQARAALVAEQCRTIGAMSGAPWLLENPRGAMSGILGAPDHVFDPFDYAGYCRDDNYTKATCLWTGGGVRHAAAAPRQRAAEQDVHPSSAAGTGAREYPQRHAGGVRAGGVSGECAVRSVAKTTTIRGG